MFVTIGVPIWMLFPVVEISAGADKVDASTAGVKILLDIPSAEIWILETFKWSRSTGSTAKSTGIELRVKGGSTAIECHTTAEAASGTIFRGIDFSESLTMREGDRLFLNVSTNNAGDEITWWAQVRKIKVG